MKKLFLTLIALAATMSINAQIVKIMNGDQLVVRHKVPNGGKVVFEKAPDLGIKGKAERTGGIEVNWVQLWEGGPRFAEYNVGAANNKAEDYGAYYSFGKITTDKDNYYNGNMALTGDDDTATKLWGDNWRMPTKKEFEALINNENCTCTWIANYEGKDVNGLLCTGKAGTAFAANSVFLPAAGYFDNRNGGDFYDQGTRGTYWSSTPVYNREDFAWVLNFHSENSESQKVFEYGRGTGYSVRAVLVE